MFGRDYEPENLMNFLNSSQASSSCNEIKETCESISDTQTPNNDHENENRLDISDDNAKLFNPYEFSPENETDLLDEIETGSKRDRQTAHSKIV